MKVFVYNFKEEEREYFEESARELGVTLGTYEGYATEETAHLARGYEGISIYYIKMDADLLQRFYDLGVRYITTRSVGYDHIDLKKARELGMRVSITPYAPETVANYTIMLMLMSLRKARQIMERSVIQDFTLTGKRGRDLSSATIGIIGTGSIGKTVIRHLSGFGCRILAYSPHPSEEVSGLAEYTDLDTLLQESDVISLHSALNPQTVHMIGEEAISKMKDGAILVNCSRGPLVDTDALIRGLESGRIGGAALDVIENEYGLYYNSFVGKPLAHRPLAVLRNFPNVIVMPHTAFYSDEAIREMTHNALLGCVLFAEGKENPFEVTCL